LLEVMARLTGLQSGFVLVVQLIIGRVLIGLFL
jgi:hypothetical protein